MRGHFEFTDMKIKKKMDDFLCGVEITPLCSVIYNFEPQGMMIHRYEEWKENKTVCSPYPLFERLEHYS